MAAVKHCCGSRGVIRENKLCYMLETPCIRRYSFIVTPSCESATVRSENPTGADNQQERPSPSDWLDAIPHDLGHYIAGFVDGEGSFNVPIRRERDRGLPWRVSLSFNVSQLGSEAPVLLQSTSAPERCEHVATVSGTSRSRGSMSSSGGHFPSSSDFSFVVRRPVTWRSFVRSPSSSRQAGTCRPTGSSKSSPCEAR